MRAELLRQQAFLASVREDLMSRGLVQVETAALHPFTVSSPWVASLFLPQAGYLQTSPEFLMKALLARGSGDIFQIAHAFRDDPCDDWHRREFLMLEWYRTQTRMPALLGEVQSFLQVRHPAPWHEVSVISVLQEWGLDGLDPSVIIQLAKVHGWQEALHPHAALDFLVQEVVHRHARPGAWCVYHNFPAALAHHAVIQDGSAMRFEIYYHTIEVANGCEEVRDAEHLAFVLRQEQALRAELGLDTVEVGDDFVRDSAGLPVVSGVAIGLDRLYSIMYGDRAKMLPMVYASSREAEA